MNDNRINTAPRPYTKLTTGRRVSVTTQRGEFKAEVISIDEHGITGYVDSGGGINLVGCAVMFPWPAIEMIAWKVDV